jgi:hypothetical protein
LEAASGDPGDLPELARYSWSLLKLSSRASRDRALLHDAYRCWREVWTATFAELDGVDRVHSDDFARQQEFVALFEEGRCIGLVGFRFLDLATEMACEDSYFKIWPEPVIVRARSISRVVCVMSNLTVHPSSRGSLGSTSVKEILTILATNRFAASVCSLALGTMRNNRGMSDLVYRYGATCLVPNAVLHGVSVDLVEFSRWSVRSALTAPKPASVIRTFCGETADRRIA